METIFTLDSLAYPIAVERGWRTYNVKYGAHVVRRLSYVEAAHELGECIFHALTCEGKTLEDV